MLLLNLLFLSCKGANRYWIGLIGGNWNNTQNWAASSGGATGVSVPGSLDIAIFDGATNVNCTIDVKDCRDELTDDIILVSNPITSQLLILIADKENAPLFEMFNSSGKQICKRPVVPVLNVNSQSPGVYFLHFIFSDKVVIKKVVII